MKNKKPDSDGVGLGGEIGGIFQPERFKERRTIVAKPTRASVRI